MYPKALNIVVTILALMAVLTSACTVQATPTLTVDDGTSIELSDANIIWQKPYGGTGDDRALYTLPVDSGFLVVGSTKSQSNATAGWALMLNSEGTVVWNHTYLEGAGTELRYAVSLADGFLLVGNQFLANDVNGYIAKVDLSGNLVWKTVVGGVNIDKLFAGAKGADGYAVFGLTFPEGNSAKSSAWIVKLDAEGNIVWQNNYGRDADTTLRAAVYTGDGYVTAGYTDPSGQSNYDYYLLKVASDGTEQWNRTYGGSESEKAHSLTATQNGYILAGESHTTQTDADAWVVKVDFDGELLWSKRVGGANADSAAYVTSARDEGFLVCGFTFSFGSGQRDFWVFKITDAGEVLFSCAVGDEAFQEAYGVVDVGGGEYVLAGWTDPAGHPELVGKATYDFWIVKISLSQQTSFPSSYLIAIGAVAFTVVIAAMLVLVRKRKTKN